MKVTHQLSLHDGTVKGVHLCPLSSRLLTACSDGCVRVWDLRQHRCLSTFTTHEDSVWGVRATDLDGDAFLSWGRDGCVRAGGRAGGLLQTLTLTN